MAKVTTRTERVTATDSTRRRTAQQPTITEAAIARRAYDLYLARGCEPGHDVEDWLQAERELSGAPLAE
jgi:hypothetical protein